MSKISITATIQEIETIITDSDVGKYPKQY